MNQVRQTFIRVNADEVTYPAHIILRYEIERDLISGSVQAKDVPELWDIKMQSYLGLSTKDNHRDGCMQDMHWAAGAFGYFPSYSLGAMTAAQLFSSMKKLMPNLEGLIGSGNLLPIQNWLKSHIWALGSFSSTNELLVHATGELLNPTYFRQHIEEKYLNLSPGETEPLEIGPDQYSVSIAP
jgi:carboxypeptidase Taq